MTLRLAVLLSHPIPNFASWHREVAKLSDIELRVFFCCDWGAVEYIDPQFKRPVKWDVPLLEGYEYEMLPIRRRPERLSFREVDNPAVGKALDRFDPNVVHVFGYAHRTNWRVAWWCRSRRRPLLIFSDSNAKAKSAWWKRVAKQIVVRRFYDRVDGAFCISESNRAYHEMYGLPVERLFPGVMPVDRSRLLSAVSDPLSARRSIRERHSIPQDAFVALLCGKYVSHKRPFDLLSSAWSAAQKGLPVWSVFVGDGPLRGEMEKFCEHSHIRNAVLTGFVNQAEVSNYYAASDVVVLPSSREAHGLVVSEAISFGLPVIVSDQIGCAGPNDVARPEVNAVVYACGDLQQLEKAIERLCLDKDLYGRMSAASVTISESQDVGVAARALADAASALKEMGPR